MQVDDELLDSLVVINKISDGITVSDSKGYFEVFNIRMQRITGYTMDEANKAGDFNALIHPKSKDRQDVIKSLSVIVNEKECRETEILIVAKDGSEKKIFVSTSLIRYKNRDMFLSVWRDITESKRLQNALQESEIRFRRLFETAQDGVLILDADTGQIGEVNKFLIDMLAYSREEFLGKKLWEIGAFIDTEKSISAFKELQIKGYVRYEDLPLKTKDGRFINVEFVSNVYEVNQMKVIQCNIRNITDRKLVEEGLRKSEINLRQASEIAHLGWWELDLASGRFTLSDGAFSLLEVNRKNSSISHADFLEFIHPEDRILVERAYRESLVNKKPYELKHRLQMKDGRIKWVSEIGRTEYDDTGHSTRFIGTIQDVTENMLLEQKLLTMAHCDALTKLPNRTFFLEEANLEISRARRTGMQCAILFIDIDHFKSVNDSLGHSVGDDLLKDTAEKLAPCIRQTDIMARLGGDEFIVFLNNIESGQDAQYIAERIREKFNAPRIIAGNDLFITVSIGITVFPHDGDSLEELLKNADTAMYVAKQSGRNMFRFFDSVMNSNVVTKMQVERGLRDALGKKEFVLFYQPIVHVADGKIRGFEALLRWFKSEGGLVLPNEFIFVAEETGLIVPIGEWVLHEACRFNKSLVDAGYTDMVMSVNISVAQLRRKGVVDIIKSALDQSGLRPELLEVEVTESLFIESFDAAIEILNAIRELGVQVSLDDFGTGYSSLVHLQKLPIMNLKIDRLFIKEIAKDSDENAMIPAIIELAHKVKLGVVAEGVETRLQLEKLVSNHCDYYQGYLFSGPIPADQVLLLLTHIRNSRPVMSDGIIPRYN